MRDYDRLPPELRLWLAGAVLPWRPKSVRRAYEAAAARQRNKAGALRELDALQARLIARDTAQVWGRDHPQAAP